MSSVGTTDTNNGFQPGDKKAGKSLSLFPRKSSVGTTDINDGFQSGDKKAGKSLSLFPRKSSLGTTDTNNGFQPGEIYTYLGRYLGLYSILCFLRKSSYSS